MNKQRLENVAVALEQSCVPHLFTMQRFVYIRVESPDFCGTPACALGHYAARRDLQKTFCIHKAGTVDTYFGLNNAGTQTGCDGASVLRHFGITTKQARELFDSYGCGGAGTPKAAARYIRNFIKRNGK